MEDQLQLQIDESGGLLPLWDETLRRAQPVLGREAVESWLRDAAPLSLKDGVLTLGAPNATARQWIEKKYGAALIHSLGEVTGRIELVMSRARVLISDDTYHGSPGDGAYLPRATNQYLV